MSDPYQYLASKKVLQQHIATQTCFHQSLFNKMLFSKVQFIIYLGVFNLNFIANAVASANCRQAEYEVGGKCCPSCSPGQHVRKHCTDFTSTSCKPCPEDTFQDSFNGREQCFSCQRCDQGLGLKVKKSCTLTSDALCEPLDGYFCTDSNRGGCMAARRHTVCSPGQYINQTGTADKDTVCLQCPDGTFSAGTSTSCQNHRICSSEGLVQIKPGTSSTDSECVERALGAGETAGIIMGVIFVILIIGVIVLAYQRRRKRRADRGYEPETSQRSPENHLNHPVTYKNVPSGHTNEILHEPGTDKNKPHLPLL